MKAAQHDRAHDRRSILAGLLRVTACAGVLAAAAPASALVTNEGNGGGGVAAACDSECRWKKRYEERRKNMESQKPGNAPKPDKPGQKQK